MALAPVSFSSLPHAPAISTLAPKDLWKTRALAGILAECLSDALNRGLACAGPQAATGAKGEERVSLCPVAC